MTLPIADKLMTEARVISDAGWTGIAETMRSAAIMLTKAEFRTLPDSLTPELEAVLQMPNFECGPIAEMFRVSKRADIPRASEKEQAFVLFWAMGLALRYGSEWRARGGTIMTEMSESWRDK